MKIALFHEVVSGGARRGANEFALAFKKLGHTVDLYIVDKGISEAEKNYYNNVYLYPFTAKKWCGGDWKVKLYKDTMELYKLYQLHMILAKDIQAKKYDLVFIHPSQYTQAPFLLRLLSLPKLYYCQEPLRMIYEEDMDTTKSLKIYKRYYERLNRKIRKEIDRKNISCADMICANSTYTQKNIERAYHFSSIVCHMGVDIKRFYPEEIPRDIDILFIGSKDPIDGFDLFEKSKEFLKKNYIIEYLLRGENWLSSDTELNTYYNRAKVVICFGKNEPFGLVPLEAMAAGCVVVAVDEGGYKDSVVEETGIRVKENPKDIAAILENLLDDKKKMALLSTNAKKIVRKEWTWEKSASKILETFSIWQKNQ